jgi:protein SCO1/2
MEKLGFRLLMTFIVSALFLHPILAQEDPVIGIVEKLDEFVPLDIEIVNEESDTVKLSDLIDKPTGLALVYYRCPGICSPLMDGIADVIDRTDLVLGEDFQVLTISFDPREGIELAQRKKNNYLNLMEKADIASEHWQFFVADSQNVARLTESVGFKYKQTGNDFLHAATFVILTEEGKISRYLNGTYFLPFELKMSVIDASKGKSGPSFNKILQYCYSYDPEGQQYVLNITKVAGTIITFIALLIFLFLVLKPILRKKRES